ncbi:MAG: tetratricopeptide repeat protein [Treponema sp.]|nr:tetratricopeptide repeat protein [Treponema sp.]
MKKKRLLVYASILVLMLGAPLYAQKVSATVADSATLTSGYEAYRSEDWTSAMFFFRKAVSGSGGATDETWYMLIMSEMYAGEFKSALGDCETFLRKYSFSMYCPYIQYQRGRCLHFLHQNENAVLALSDFCHQYPNHDLYASALYWIAESFYAEYNYNSARGLYERIVMDFPRDSKVGAAQYRIDSIDQKSREEKLLYLLKVTGEESLAAREDYERQLKLLEAEDKLGLRQQLTDARSRIEQLEKELGEANASLAELPARSDKVAKKTEKGGVHDLTDISTSASPEKTGTSQSGAPYYTSPYAPVVQPRAEGDPEVEALKRKARQLQYIIEEQKSTEETK